MAEANMYENPSIPRRPGGRTGPGHEVVDLGDGGAGVYVNERAVDVSADDVGGSAIMKDFGSQRSIVSNKELAEKKRIKREKKMEKEKGKREKEEFREMVQRKFGKLTAGMGGKAIIAFLLLIIVISIIACVFVVLIYIASRVERPDPEYIKAQQERIRQDDEELKAMIVDIYKKLQKQMIDIEEKFDSKMERIVLSIEDETERVEDVIEENEEKAAKKFNSTGEIVDAITKAQDRDIKQRFKDQTGTVVQKSKEHHDEASLMLSDMETDISRLFANQDKAIDGLVLDVRREMIRFFSANGDLIDGKLESVEESLNIGFEEKGHNFSTELTEIQEHVETGLTEIKEELTTKIEKVGIRALSKNTEFQRFITREFKALREEVKRKEYGQNNIIQDLLSGAVVDVANQYFVSEARLLEHLTGKNEYTENKFLANIDELSDLLKDLNEDAKTVASAAERHLSTNYNAECEDIPENTRFNCGWDGISIEDCFNQGCCYDLKTMEKQKCYKKVGPGHIFSTKFKGFLEEAENDKKDVITFIENEITDIEEYFKKDLNYKIPETCEEIRYSDSPGTYGPSDRGEIYKIYLLGKPQRVYCDETSLGWMVVLRQINDMGELYDKTYSEYEGTLGDMDSKNYWAGLKFLNEVTSKHRYKVRIEVFKKDLSITKQVYDLFKVGDAASGYKLTVGKLVPDESDALVGGDDFNAHDGRVFSAKDKGPDWLCARDRGGGWWYIKSDKCQEVKLTGKAYATSADHMKKIDGIIHGKVTTFYSYAHMSIKRFYTDTR